MELLDFRDISQLTMLDNALQKPPALCHCLTLVWMEVLEAEVLVYSSTVMPRDLRKWAEDGGWSRTAASSDCTVSVHDCASSRTVEAIWLLVAGWWSLVLARGGRSADWRSCSSATSTARAEMVVLKTLRELHSRSALQRQRVWASKASCVG